ncbi:MAG: DNA-directed RNA polymerase subunit RpoH/Rpb5 C-terminal domain-containing protein [Promethearchaeota archaeon]|jgi:DNA-directed RNA polymerase subunit H (RpoH/RPB5)
MSKEEMDEQENFNFNEDEDDSNNTTIYKITDNVRNTCLDIINQRDYTIIKEENTTSGNGMLNVIICKKPDGETFLVLLNIIDKFNIATLKETSTILTQYDCKHAIVVYKSSYTSAASKSVQQMASNEFGDKMHFEVFNEEDLQYNITKHILQPFSFENLTDMKLDDLKDNFSESFIQQAIDKVTLNKSDINELDKNKLIKEQIKIQFRQKWAKIPIMKLNDPISRFYNYKKGDIIKILRRNGIVCYRKII